METEYLILKVKTKSPLYFLYFIRKFEVEVLTSDLLKIKDSKFNTDAAKGRFLSQSIRYSRLNVFDLKETISVIQANYIALSNYPLTKIKTIEHLASNVKICELVEGVNQWTSFFTEDNIQKQKDMDIVLSRIALLPSDVIWGLWKKI